MTIEEAIQEIKAYIDESNQSQLIKMNNKLQEIREHLHNLIKSGIIIKEKSK